MPPDRRARRQDFPGSSPPRALTTAGNENLLHGRLDWVYQEEVYGRGNFQGYFWSPDSRFIAYLEIDLRDVLNYTIVDHRTFVFLGDGCLMEGISHETCSLAGTWGLGKLIAFWDDNGISIDGHVEGWFKDDTPKRFEAYGWNVIPAVDGHNVEAVSAAIHQAKLADKPTLICCRTVIGKGSPNLAGTDKVHGAALGDKEIAAVSDYIAGLR